jgi:hypothetical protein
MIRPVLSSLAVRDPAAILEFVRRDWASFERSEAEYWRAYRQEQGPGAGIAVADELRRHLARVRPEWPTERERREDHETHLRVIEALRRVPPRDR